MEFPATVDFFALQNQIRSGAFEHILPLTFKQILMIWLQADTGYHRSKLETTPMRYLKAIDRHHHKWKFAFRVHQINAHRNEKHDPTGLLTTLHEHSGF